MKNVRKLFVISRALKKCFFEAQQLAVESRVIFDLLTEKGFEIDSRHVVKMAEFFYWGL